jgi:hypothetical protein
MKLLKKGDRIRLNVRTIAGWKGKGTVMQDQKTPESSVRFIKDGTHLESIEYEIGCEALRREVSMLRAKSK